MISDITQIPRWITLRYTAELTGYSEKALLRKIEERKLPKKLVWVQDPDNKHMINIRNFMLWLEKRL